MVFARALPLIAVLSLFAACGSAQKFAHIYGSLTYEGSDATTAKAVPTNADPQVNTCLGSSSLASLVGRAVGIKTSEAINPPFFVGLWPAPKKGQVEVHGRTDQVSVGRPLPGDQPFLKFVVCKLDIDINYDWTIKSQLDGDYYVGAWFDRDMNGYPGLTEPLGFYRGDGTAPATMNFRDGKAKRINLAIGQPVESLDKQVEALRQALQDSLQQLNFDQFSNQFQPLYFKDPFNRTINQIDSLYGDLTSDTNKASNKIKWKGDPPAQASAGAAVGALVLTQTKDPKIWTQDQNLETNVSIALGAAKDGLYQLMDWKPVSERSGDLLTVDPSTPPPDTFDGTSPIAISLNINQPVMLWYGIEKFVASATSPSGGTWTTFASPITYWNAVATGPQKFTFTNASASQPALVSLVFDPASLLRITFMPITTAGPAYAKGYTQWPKAFTRTADSATAPTQGNYLRFYVYGTQYVYRKTISTK